MDPGRIDAYDISSAKCCDLLRSPFRCDRKTAIERDHAATASDQTKFKVAEGRSKVAVRCDWGIKLHSLREDLNNSASSKLRTAVYIDGRKFDVNPNSAEIFARAFGSENSVSLVFNNVGWR